MNELLFDATSIKFDEQKWRDYYVNEDGKLQSITYAMRTFVLDKPFDFDDPNNITVVMNGERIRCYVGSDRKRLIEYNTRATVKIHP